MIVILKGLFSIRIKGLGVVGYNIFADMYGCDSSILNDVEYLRVVMEGAAKKGKMRIVRTVFNRYTPQGISSG